MGELHGNRLRDTSLIWTNLHCVWRSQSGMCCLAYSFLCLGDLAGAMTMLLLVCTITSRYNANAQMKTIK